MTRPITNAFSLLSKTLRSSLFKAAGTYGFFSLFNSAIPFFLLPVMTRYLTPADYGYVAIFNILVTLLIPFCGLNIPGAYARAYYAGNRFVHEIYMGTGVILTLLSGLAITVLLFLFREFFGRVFSFPPGWLWLASVVACSMVLVQFVQVSWQVRENPRPYGMFQNTRTFSELSLAILFVVFCGLGWHGRVFSRVFVAVCFAAAGILILKRKDRAIFRFNRGYALHGLKFGIPLIPHSLALILNTSIGRIFISHMVGIADTGLYTVGFQIGSIISLFAAAFNQAYVPWLYKRLNLDSMPEKRKIVRLTYSYFAVITVCAVGLSILAPLAMTVLVGREFQGSSVYVVWIALGYAFHGMYLMVVNYIFYAEKTHLLAIATMAGSLLNVVLNYVFIKMNGAVGAAQASTLTYLFTFLFVWYLSSRVYSMPWGIFSKTANEAMVKS